MDISEIVCSNKTTGQPDFTDYAKVGVSILRNTRYTPLAVVDTYKDCEQACVADLDNWTIGPVFRRYLPNMDQLVNIRLNDDFPEPRIPDET